MRAHDEERARKAAYRHVAKLIADELERPLPSPAGTLRLELERIRREMAAAGAVPELVAAEVRQ